MPDESSRRTGRGRLRDARRGGSGGYRHGGGPRPGRNERDRPERSRADPGRAERLRAERARQRGAVPARHGLGVLGRRGLTGRAVVLALVLCTLAVTFALPLREFVVQRGEIAALRERTVVQEQRVAELQAERDRWRDPAYVKAQAKARLGLVMPGEIPYTVLDDPDPSPTPEGAPESGEERSWWQDLWRSLRSSDGQ